MIGLDDFAGFNVKRAISAETILHDQSLAFDDAGMNSTSVKDAGHRSTPFHLPEIAAAMHSSVVPNHTLLTPVVPGT